MPGYLCTSAMVLAAAGFGAFTMAVAPSNDNDAAPLAAVINQTDGVAIDGYDPVAYFVDGEPARGTPRFEMEYQGSIYRFSSEENLEAFSRDPSAYLPQLGGYSVFGMAKGKRYDINPTAFDIIDGKLYLSRNRKVRELWQVNLEGFINRAEENWRALYAP